MLEDFLSERRGAQGRDARRRCAARSGGCSSSPSATPSSRCSHDALARRTHARPPRGGARGAARGARPRGAAGADRVLRRLEPGRVERASRRWSCSRRPCRARSDYRQFGIRHEGGQDDFRSIAEAVRRRFARHRLVEEEGYDRSFATLPNLVVIDGGKGQLVGGARGDARVRPAARRGRLARQARGGGLRARALATSVRLPRDSPGCCCCSASATRRTASRSRFHRARRGAGQTASLLDALPGVGRRAAARAGRALRRRRTRLLDASREELEAVPGLPAKVGRDLYDHLHRTGRFRRT